MLLAIEVGNTNSVFALITGDQILCEWRTSTKGDRTADEYYAWLAPLMSLNGYAHADIHDAVISSVAPQTNFNLRTLCRKYFDSDPLFVGDAECELGIAIKNYNMAEVGADRLLNAVSGVEKYGPSLIVVDFGTATNFDVIDHEGAFIGGILAPGVNLSLEALARAAAKLPRVAVERPEHIIGRNTEEAMQSGIYWGYISLIEGLCSRIMNEFGGPMTVISTGGLAPLFAVGTETIQHVDEDLTLRGLITVYRRNRGGISGEKS